MRTEVTTTLVPQAMPKVVRVEWPILQTPADTSLPFRLAEGTFPYSEAAEAKETRWLRTHGQEVDKYAGEWVAIKGEGIIAHGPTLKAVISEARRLRVERPLIIRVPSRKLPGLILLWR